MRPSGLLVTIVPAAALLASPRVVARQEHVITVEPSQVDVRMLYHEASVHVTAPVPAGAEVAILLVGREHELALKRKGKVFGLIWMNVGDVTFQAVPDVYLLSTTCAPVDLAEPQVLDRLGLGFDALKARAASTAEADTLFEDLVRLKEHDGLWEISEDRVTVEPAGRDGGAVATADFALPARTPPGDYRVLAYTFVGFDSRLVGEGHVRVAQGGVAAFIAGLSQRHRLLYGVLAVLIAGGAGLLTGVVFGRSVRKGR